MFKGDREGKRDVEDKMSRVLRRERTWGQDMEGGSVYLIWEIKLVKASGRASKPASGDGALASLQGHPGQALGPGSLGFVWQNDCLFPPLTVHVPSCGRLSQDGKGAQRER